MSADLLKEFGENYLLYFSHDACNVCKVLKPKVQEMINNLFPKVGFHYIDINKFPEFAAVSNAFTAPVVLVFFENKEVIRKVRTFSVIELEESIERYYRILFD
jgi:thioredoxin 1